MKGSLGDIFSLILLSVCLLAISVTGYPKEPERGVAVEPMKIIVKDNQVSYFTVYNDTDNEYVITARIVREDGRVGGSFALTSPFCYLSKRNDVKIGVIHLTDKKSNRKDNVFYLSISFIPKKYKPAEKVDIPLVLVQQVPIIIEQ